MKSAEKVRSVERAKNLCDTSTACTPGSVCLPPTRWIVFHGEFADEKKSKRMDQLGWNRCQPIDFQVGCVF